MSAVRNKNLRPKNLPADPTTTLNFQNNSNASSGMNVNNNTTPKSRLGTSVARNSPKTTPKTAKRSNTPANRAPSTNRAKPAKRSKTPTNRATPANRTTPAKRQKTAPGTVRRVAPVTAAGTATAGRVGSVTRSRAETPRNKRVAARNAIREKTLKTTRGKVVKRAQKQTKVIKPPGPNKRVKLTNNSNTKTNNKNVKPNNARNTKTNNKNVKPNNARNTKTNNKNVKPTNANNTKTNNKSVKLTNNSNTKSNKSNNNASIRTGSNNSRQSSASTVSTGKRSNVLNAIQNNRNINNPIVRGLHYLYSAEGKKKSIAYVTQKNLENIYKKKTYGDIHNQFNKQVELLSKRQYPSLKVLQKKLKKTQNGDAFIIRMNPQVNEDEFEMDFMFLMWLDAIHDGTTKKSFKTFISEDEGPAEIVFGKDRKTTYKETKFIKRIIDFSKSPKKKETAFIVRNDNIIIKNAKSDKGTNEKAKAWEGRLADNLLELFEIENKTKVHPIESKRVHRIIDNLFKKTVRVSIDQEDKQKSSSFAIFDSRIRNERKKEKKMIQPYMTIGNLLDPGGMMPQQGFQNNIKTLMSPIGKKPHSRLSWNFACINFIINKNIDIRIGYDKYNKESRYTLTINGNKIPTSISAKKAQSSQEAEHIVSKFMGDFLQILYVSSMSFDKQLYNEGKPREIALATGDRMATIVSTFIATRIYNKVPKIIQNKPNDINIYLIGMDDNINEEYKKILNNANLTTVASETTQSNNNNRKKNNPPMAGLERPRREEKPPKRLGESPKSQKTELTKNAKATLNRMNNGNNGRKSWVRNWVTSLK